MEPYLPPFLKAFLAAIVLFSVFSVCLKKIKIPNGKRGSKRHIHKRNISRLGGAVIILSFAAAIFFDSHLVITSRLWGIFAAIGLIFVFGIWDDFRELNWKTQFFFQAVAVAVIFLAGVKISYITNPFGGIVFFSGGIYALCGFLLMFFWVIFLMNAVNWLDGVDGLSGGVTIVGSATIFLLSIKPEVNQPPIGIITAALGGAILAFLIYNFHPAKFFAGTSGSMFMGFILAVLAIFAGAKIATTLLVVAIPVIDMIWVMGERWRAGESIYKSDQRHLHFKLLELGWSPKKIALFFYIITILIAIVALNTRAIGKLITIVLVAAIMVGALILINQKISKLRQET